MGSGIYEEVSLHAIRAQEQRTAGGNLADPFRIGGFQLNAIPVPRSLAHVLLSLLLLFTQQLSLLHGVTHTTGSQQGPARVLFAQAGADTDGAGGKLPKPGMHDLCAQCAFGAQLAFALPVAIRLFAPLDLVFALVATPRAPVICLLTRCVFQSRAPPQA
jgi:hypothetical protein